MLRIFTEERKRLDDEPTKYIQIYHSSIYHNFLFSFVNILIIFLFSLSSFHYFCIVTNALRVTRHERSKPFCGPVSKTTPYRFPPLGGLWNFRHRTRIETPGIIPIDILIVMNGCQQFLKERIIACYVNGHHIVLEHCRNFWKRDHLVIFRNALNIVCNTSFCGVTREISYFGINTCLWIID